MHVGRRRSGWALVALGCALGLSGAPAHAGMRAMLHALQGRVVYVDFWASWCVPCRESFPWMKALEQRYARRGLSIVAVNLNHHRRNAEQFLRVFRPDFTVVFDPSGRLARRYKIIGMPTSFLIDRSGHIQFTHTGFFLRQRGEYEREVRELLAQEK